MLCWCTTTCVVAGRPRIPEHRRKHGLHWNYSSQGCRCELCTAAWREYQKERRALKVRQRHVLEAILSGGQAGADRRVELGQAEFKYIMQTIKEELQL